MPSPDTARILITAIACWVTGLVAVFATAGPDQVAILFPPAGIGIAAVLVFGRKLLAGAFIGSFATVLSTLGLAQAGNPDMIVLAAALGLVRATQAAVGAMMVRRMVPVDAPPPFEARSILILFTLAGPVSCLISAFGGVLVLDGLGLLGAESHIDTVLKWWIADTLGVAVFLPLGLALSAQPRYEWRPLLLTVGMPLLLVGLILATALSRLQADERREQQSAFERKSVVASRSLSNRINDALLTLQSVHSFASSSKAIDRAEFRRFTSPFLERTPVILAIGLSEYVRDEQRESFIEQTRLSRFEHFNITERGHDNSLHIAARRPDHMVITLIEPLQVNRRALGLDSMSVAAARSAIRLAVRSGAQIATAGFELTQAQETGVVIYQSVPRKQAISSEIDVLTSIHPAGVVFVTLRVGELARQSLAPFVQELDYCLFDVTDPTPVRLVGSTRCEASASDAPESWLGRLAVGGRTWALQLNARPITASLAQTLARSTPAFATMFGILTLASFLMLISGRAGQVARLVEQRTRKLAEEIVERRRIAGALAHSEQQLRTLIGNTPVGIVEITRDNRIHKVNPYLCKLLGMRESNLLGKRLLDLVSDPDRHSTARAWAGLLSAETMTSDLRLHLLHADGEAIQVDVITTSILDTQGEAVRFVAVVLDQTEAAKRRVAEAARSKAEAASRAKTEFVARMSHELRTPLNALLGFAQLLGNRPDEPLTTSQAESVRVIEQSGWHLLDMINDLLELSRIESGNVRIALGPVDIVSISAECVHLAESLCREANVKLVSSVERSARYVVADPTRLRQVLLNLLSNAIKYNRPGGLVHIETGVNSDPAGDQIAIRIRDTGTGMSTDQLSHLFEPFNRLGRDESIQGTGIGLTIAQNLVQLMGGSLLVESHENEGSCFTVVLRAASGPRPDLPLRPAQSQTSKSAQATDS